MAIKRKASVDLKLSLEQANRLLRHLSENSHCPKDDMAYTKDCLLCETAERLAKACVAAERGA